MNDISYSLNIDVTSQLLSYDVYVASKNDTNIRYLNIALFENGNAVPLSENASATASFVTNNVLIDEDIACTIDGNIITVPLTDLQQHGNLDIQVTVTDGSKTLATPYPIQVKVTPNIAETAQIDENSMGSYAEVVQEIAEARGSYDKLNDRLDHTAAPTNEQVATAVSEWLDDHPEATTTVQDGTLTYKKLMGGDACFVTPEMFGAVGDGVTDDTAAFRAALAYRVVYATNRYCISDITQMLPGTLIFGGGTLIQNSDSTDHKLFNINNSRNITIEGMELVSGSSSNARTEDGGNLLFQNCTNIRILNTAIVNNAARFIMFVNCENVLCDQFNAEENHGTVFTALNSSNVTYQRGKVVFSSDTYGAHALDVYAKAVSSTDPTTQQSIEEPFTVSGINVNDIYVKGIMTTENNTRVYQNTSGVQFTAEQAKGCSFMNFSMRGNVFEQCAGGFKQDGLNNCVFNDCVCIDCETGFATRGLSTTACESLIIKNCVFRNTDSNHTGAACAIYNAFQGTKFIELDGCEMENYLVPFRTNQGVERLVVKNCYIHSAGLFKFFSNATDYFEQIEFISNIVRYSGTTYRDGNRFYPFTPCGKLIMKDNQFTLGTALISQEEVLFGFSVLTEFVFSGNTFDAIISDNFYVSLPAAKSTSSEKCCVTYSENTRSYTRNDVVYSGKMKLVISENINTSRSVTPEMYGAEGDGVTDDTTAIQAAIDSGFPVRFTGGAYKCGTIHVDHDCEIDCCGASFVCTENLLFNCGGTAAEAYAGADYTKWQEAYALGSGKTHTGLVMLKGLNNVFHARSDYLGGFVGRAYNGVLHGAYPINVTDVSIEEITPVCVTIRNIRDTSFVTDGQNVVICFRYNDGSLAENIRQRSKCFSVVQMDSSYGCAVRNCDIILGDYTYGSFNYPIHFKDSSLCSIEGCSVFNHKWNCASTGGVYLCYRNSIRGSRLMTDCTHPAFHDSDNGLGTRILDSEVASVTVGALSEIDGVTIHPCGDGNYASGTTTNVYLSAIQLQATDDVSIADYSVKNVRIIGYHGIGNNATTRTGVFAYVSPNDGRASEAVPEGENFAYTYRLGNILLENVVTDKIENGVVDFRFGHVLTDEENPRTYTAVVSNVSVYDSNLALYLNGDENTAVGSLRVRNLKPILDGSTPRIGWSTKEITDVYITDSKIGILGGGLKTVRMENCVFTRSAGNTDSIYYINNSEVIMQSATLKAGNVYIKNSRVGTSASDLAYRDVVGISAKGYWGKYLAAGYTLSEIT